MSNEQSQKEVQNGFTWSDRLLKSSKNRSINIRKDLDLRNFNKGLITAFNREIDKKGKVNRFGYLARTLFGFQSTKHFMENLVLSDLLREVPEDIFYNYYKYIFRQKDLIVRIRALLVADSLHSKSLIDEKNAKKLKKRLIESQSSTGFFILKQSGGNRYEFQPRIPLGGDLYVQLLFIDSFIALDALNEIDTDLLIKNVIKMQNKDGGFRHCLDPNNCSHPQGKNALCPLCNSPSLRTKTNVLLKELNQTKWSGMLWTSNALEILARLNALKEIDTNLTYDFIMKNQLKSNLFQFKQNYNFKNYHISNPNIFEGTSITHTYIPSTLAAVIGLKHLNKLQPLNKKAILSGLDRYKIKKEVRRTKKTLGSYSTVGKIPEFKHLSKKYRRGFQTSILVNTTNKALRTIEIISKI